MGTKEFVLHADWVEEKMKNAHILHALDVKRDFAIFEGFRKRSEINPDLMEIFINIMILIFEVNML